MVFKELENGMGREKRRDEGCEMSVGLRGKGNQKVRAANLRNQAPRNFWRSEGGSQLCIGRKELRFPSDLSVICVNLKGCNDLDC